MKQLNSISFKLLIFLLISCFPSLQKAQKFGSFQNAASFSHLDGGFFVILDKGTSEVLKIDYEGNVLKRIGGTGWDDYTFDNPTDLSASMLRIYITDRNNSRIQVYDYELNFLFSLDSKNLAPAKGAFRYPVSAAASPYGDLYIADSDNKQIIKFNSKWEYVSSFAGNEYGRFAAAAPAKIAVDSKSNVFLLDGKRIIQYDQFGNGKDIIEAGENIINIRTFNNLLLIVYGESLGILDLAGSAGKRIPFSLFAPLEGKRVVDVIQAGDKTFFLTENSIVTIPKTILE